MNLWRLVRAKNQVDLAAPDDALGCMTRANPLAFRLMEATSPARPGLLFGLHASAPTAIPDGEQRGAHRMICVPMGDGTSRVTVVSDGTRSPGASVW